MALSTSRNGTRHGTLRAQATYGADVSRMKKNCGCEHCVGANVKRMCRREGTDGTLGRRTNHDRGRTNTKQDLRYNRSIPQSAF
jgi:hypothetical protein